MISLQSILLLTGLAILIGVALTLAMDRFDNRDYVTKHTYCGECGTQMIHHNRPTSDGKYHIYWLCPNYLRSSDSNHDGRLVRVTKRPPQFDRQTGEKVGKERPVN